jgi:acyl-CoA thioester hydrolase
MPAFIHHLSVRFRDCDPMGHANNAVYFTYLEETRFAHWRELWGARPSSKGGRQLPAGMPGVILAHAECDFRRPVRYGERLAIALTVAEVRRSSFRYQYVIADEEGRTVAEARTVQVMYDYDKEQPVRVPDEIRELLMRHSA